MPAVLDGEEEVRRWLDFGEVKSSDALSLLQSKNILTFHPVSSVVNNSRNNYPECLQPLDLNSKKVLLHEPPEEDFTAWRIFLMQMSPSDLQETKPTASSKMMMTWLSSGSPSKSKEAGVSERKKDGKEKKKRESSALQQWLQKKARTKWNVGVFGLLDVSWSFSFFTFYKNTKSSINPFNSVCLIQDFYYPYYLKSKDMLKHCRCCALIIFIIMVNVTPLPPQKN